MGNTISTPEQIAQLNQQVQQQTLQLQEKIRLQQQAQQEAQRLLQTMLDHEQLRSLYKTDHRKMLKGQLPKTTIRT